MATVKLAEALLQRKHLNEKVEQLREVKEKHLFEVKSRRQSVSEGLDEVVASVPKVTLNQVTHAYDFHAKRLRKIDAAIQQANWTADIDVGDCMDDYVAPEVPQAKKGLLG